MKTRWLISLLLSGALCFGASLAGDLQITLLQTTDLHGAALGAGHAAPGQAGASGSYARIAAYVRQVRASAGHPVLLVDSGDWSMGTYYDLTLGGRPLPLRFMDALGYDCATLGNHEFDYGPAGLARMLTSARDGFGFRTPLVASNLEPGADRALAPLLGPGRQIAPVRVATLGNGLKVGYLGLMGRDAAADAPASAPLRFTDYARDYRPLQALVDDLRGRQGCAMVIALAHAGTDASGEAGEDVDLARQVRGIDVIASGHMHHTLGAARSIGNDGWTTRIIGAGAFGGHVARIDLTYHPRSHSSSLDDSACPAMTDPGLHAIRAGLGADPGMDGLVRGVDQELNACLGEVFSGLAGFRDYRPAEVASGLYHPVGAAALDLAGNGREPAPGPNGLGNLCADAFRAVPNALLAEALRARERPAGFDPTPFSVAVVGTGMIRSALPAGVPLRFADVYNVLPLGRSPDRGQGLATGYPLLSAYLDAAGLRRLCALQLLAQCGLTGPDYYLHLSGLRYALQADELATCLRYATAAAVLAGSRGKAEAGSPEAARALAALARAGRDGGAALRAQRARGNAFARAMLRLDAAGPAGTAANLDALAQVAAAGEAAPALVAAKAEAAVGALEGFSPADPACTGATAPLTGGRFRVAADLYALLMLGAARNRFGIAITAYRSAGGAEVLSGDDLEAAMGSRISLQPLAVETRETKGWMALLLYLRTPPERGGHFRDGLIGPEYGPTGAAVRVRAAGYPAAAIARLQAAIEPLRAAP